MNRDVIVLPRSLFLDGLNRSQLLVGIALHWFEHEHRLNHPGYQPGNWFPVTNRNLLAMTRLSLVTIIAAKKTLRAKGQVGYKRGYINRPSEYRLPRS